MSLKEILQKMVEDGEPVLLLDSDKNWEASDLLNQLSQRTLGTRAHLQPGMYIAEINETGYLGRVMYRVKRKT
jgi:hypothetical protein